MGGEPAKFPLVALLTETDKHKIFFGGWEKTLGRVGRDFDKKQTFATAKRGKKGLIR